MDNLYALAAKVYEHVHRDMKIVINNGIESSKTSMFNVSDQPYTMIPRQRTFDAWKDVRDFFEKFGSSSSFHEMLKDRVVAYQANAKAHDSRELEVWGKFLEEFETSVKYILKKKLDSFN